MSTKKRLDVLVYERGMAPSREMARRYIMAGEITVNGQLHTKPGSRFPENSELVIKEPAKYVSRGGLKLESALKVFPITVNERICADVGASTGGFTDYLLQHGAARVYAIDVGYGQLAVKLRNDERVINMERTNARHLDSLDEPVSLIVIDASFISLRLLLPAIKKWITPDADIIPLIKPQFEAGKKDVGKGGIIRDQDVHRRVLAEIFDAMQQQGFYIYDLVKSEITGSKGNIEFLTWLKTAPPPSQKMPETLITRILPENED